MTDWDIAAKAWWKTLGAWGRRQVYRRFFSISDELPAAVPESPWDGWWENLDANRRLYIWHQIVDG
jgi:hypothetical protein